MLMLSLKMRGRDNGDGETSQCKPDSSPTCTKEMFFTFTDPDKQMDGALPSNSILHLGSDFAYAVNPIEEM